MTHKDTNKLAASRVDKDQEFSLIMICWLHHGNTSASHVADWWVIGGFNVNWQEVIQVPIELVFEFFSVAVDPMRSFFEIFFFCWQGKDPNTVLSWASSSCWDKSLRMVLSTPWPPSHEGKELLSMESGPDLLQRSEHHTPSLGSIHISIQVPLCYIFGGSGSFTSLQESLFLSGCWFKVNPLQPPNQPQILKLSQWQISGRQPARRGA